MYHDQSRWWGGDVTGNEGRDRDTQRQLARTGETSGKIVWSLTTRDKTEMINRREEGAL